MTKRSKKNIRLTVFALICVFAICYGGVNAVLLNQNKEEDDTAQYVQAINDTGLSPNADVEWEYCYLKCKHSEYIKVKASNDMVGKTGEEIAKLYDAKLISYNRSKLSLKKEINGYCTKHYILKKNSDGVAIYVPISGSDQLNLYKNTDVAFSSLSGTIKTEVEEGKAFDSLENLEYFLESIDS